MEVPIEPGQAGHDGHLHEPSTMKLHPRGLNGAWLDRWAEVMGAVTDWVHHGVDRNTTYRSKAERLMGGRRQDDACTGVAGSARARTRHGRERRRHADCGGDAGRP